MKDEVNALFAAISSGLFKTGINEFYRDLLSKPEFLKTVSNFAAFHDLSHLLYYSLLEEKIITKKQGAVFSIAEQCVASAKERDEKLDSKCQKVYALFEEQGIPFIPLKGAVIKKFYPKPWMRTSCDADILVKEKDLEKAVDLIKSQIGGETVWSGDHDVPIFFNDKTHIELHFSFSDLKAEHEKIMQDVWTRAKAEKGFNYKYEMPQDMFYFYHIAHMAKHIKNGGCGIKPFIDLYYLDSLKIDGREEILTSGGLLVFANNASLLSKTWLQGNMPKGDLLTFAKFILRGGSYGTYETRAEQDANEKINGRLNRVFLPYSKLKYYYKELENNKWLYPYFSVKRFIKIVFKTLPVERKKGKSPDPKRTEETKEIMKKMGL